MKIPANISEDTPQTAAAIIGTIPHTTASTDKSLISITSPALVRTMIGPGKTPPAEKL